MFGYQCDVLIDSTAVTDPYFSNVVLLCGFEGNFTDQSIFLQGDATLVDGATTGSSNPLTGTQSAVLDGTLDAFYWHAPTIENRLQLFYPTSDLSTSISPSPNGIWTFEFQWRPTAAGEILGGLWTGIGGRSWFLSAYGDGHFRFFSLDVATAFDITTSVGLWSAGNTYMVGADSDGSVVRLYLDGAMIGTVVSTAYTSIVEPALGRAFGPNTGFDSVGAGEWDELRVTNGICRYGSSAGYTPGPLPWPRS